MCSCLKQKLLNISFNKSNMYNLKKENFENFNDLFFLMKLICQNINLTFHLEKHSKYKNKSIDFVKNFDNPDYKNLLFTGATGLR